MNWREIWGWICCAVLFWHVLDRIEDIARAAKAQLPARSLLALLLVAAAWAALLAFIFYGFFIAGK